jgi:glyceraldehyde-3-phosphate dehydrogenase (NAD(P))
LKKFRVGVVGFGTIGSRVANAIDAQDDMEVTGIVKTSPNYYARIAQTNGYPIFAVTPEQTKKFQEYGYHVEGVMTDLLRKINVVVDATPKGCGIGNKIEYEKAKLKMVFQGGEDFSVADHSFVAQSNYEEIQRQDPSSVRVVSCNTTALCRIIGAIKKFSSIDQLHSAIIRRAADPSDVTHGPINSIIPSPLTPSHHASDVNTIYPNLKISTMACVVPTTLMHIHMMWMEVTSKINRKEVVDVLSKTPRICVIPESAGLDSTANILDWARVSGRKQGDFFEVAVWENSIRVIDKWIHLTYGVHQESIVVPENIDAIRSLVTSISDIKSISTTDTSLGVRSGYLFEK